MASPPVLAFDAEGRPVKFETWLDDLHLFLQLTAKEDISLYDHALGHATAPDSSANSTLGSQWQTRDAHARFAIRNSLPLDEREHFGQCKTAKDLYTTVVARYSSPASATLGRLTLPYLFPDLASFHTVADLITHLKTSEARFRAAMPAEFLTSNPPPLWITLYHIVTRLPDSLRAVRDHFLSRSPTELTVALLEKELLAAEASIVAVGTSRGDPRTPFFEGCSPSPLLPSVAQLLLSTFLVLRRSGPRLLREGAAGTRGAGVGSGGEVGVEAVGVEARLGRLVAAVGEETAAVGVVRSGSGGGGGRGGGRGGGGRGGGGGGGGRGGTGGGQSQQPAPTLQAAREWYAQRGFTCTYVIRTGDRSGQQCGRPHPTQRCFARLTDAWRTQFPAATELPRWADLEKRGVDIWALDFDAILTAMYAMSISGEGAQYLRVPPDPGIQASPTAALGASASAPTGPGEAAALGASASVPPGTESTAALHTFTLDSGASRSFFRDRTVLEPLARPVAVSLADPSGGPVIATSSTVLPCPAVPSGTLSGLYLPSFSTNLVAGSALQDGGVHQFTPAYERVTHCTCARTGRHLATFTREPGSDLYTLTTESPQVAASASASASGQLSAPCSCRSLAHETVLWHHRLGHPSVQRLRTMHKRTCCWSPGSRLQLSERFRSDFPVLRLHSDRGGEFSSGLLEAFCQQEGIEQSYTLPASPQQNGVAERAVSDTLRISSTSGPVSPCPRLLRHCVGRERLAMRRIFGSGIRAFVRDTSADKLSRRAVPCVFLGFVPDAPGWQFYHPTSRRVLASQDVTFDESVPYYHLFPTPYRNCPAPPPPLFLAPGAEVPDPLPPQGAAPSGVSQVDPGEPVEVAVDSRPARGAESGGAASGGAEPGSAESGGAEPGGAWSLRSGAPGAADPGGGAAAGTEDPDVGAAAGAEDSDVGAAAGAEDPSGGAAAAAEDPGVGATTGAEDPAGGAAAGAVDPDAGAPTGTEDRSWSLCFWRRCAAATSLLPPTSPLPAPSPYTGPTGGLTKRREPESRPASPVRPARTGSRVRRERPPPVPGTHYMTLRPSTAPQRVPLPSPPASSLPDVPDPESDRYRAEHPTVTCLLATVVTDPTFESSAASALVAELVDFAAACRLDYAASLVAESESESVCPPSVGVAPEGDSDAPDIPTPRTYAEAMAGPYSSQWQTAMDAEMASWKSTRTYVDKVPPPGANIVSGMWIFRVKRPPGSPLVFKARYVARGFSQREGVDFFQTFSPTPKMTTLRVLLHIAAHRDYELHSLDFSTAFLQGSLHEEIWLRRLPGFTGSFPPGTQWRLQRPVYGLRQAPREWHDTLRTTLAALGFAPSTADPSLFLRTDTSLPLSPFYILVYVDDLVFATADTAGLAYVKSELQRRHTCTDLVTHGAAGPSALWLHVLSLVLSPQSTPLPTGHSLSALPSDESVEPSGPYPELVGCLMYLMTCTRPDLAYPLSILAPMSLLAVTGRSTWMPLRGCCATCAFLGALWRSSSLFSAPVCEAEIYATAMAAQELRWLTYLLTDLGERPRSPPVLYVDNKAAIALCEEHILEHRTKHIALRYFLARELQQRGQLCIRYVATEANTADVFTKALQPRDHQRFCTLLGLACGLLDSLLTS
ncbi:unnamed protein product [Closterium sp. Yama58-4]|nr:unnamed protein product [Closterium sp. Yama58-4]